MDFVRVPLQPQALKERLARFTLSTWRLRREYLCLARSSIQFLEILPLPFAIEASADACGGSECPLFGPAAKCWPHGVVFRCGALATLK